MTDDTESQCQHTENFKARVRKLAGTNPTRVRSAESANVHGRAARELALRVQRRVFADPTGAHHTTTEGEHPDLAPDHKPRRLRNESGTPTTPTENAVGRAARPASLAFPLRPASSRGDRGPRAFVCRLLGLAREGDLR
jgi:hypothetical protein